jgi:hypothetical protein
MDFDALCRLQRFARCWNLVHNRERFPLLVSDFHARIAPDFYTGYQRLAHRIAHAEGKLFAIAPSRLERYLREEL